ncbi:glutathione S-transferase family protein [Reinekea sp. G2M2-21]|uniref:glutathione S-transferase family protein n=1 Tax=Reinekea sp. G2M2-21 TaxID=2788942 RepID=UPI0018A9BD74|nr:glutathione S-transferase family protein [Reinekea sp. G2M2-21]
MDSISLASNSAGVQPVKFKDNMRLFATPNSPFSRMARIAIHELGLSDQVDIQFVTVRDSKSELLNYGPLGKVPALQIGDDLFSDTSIIIKMLESASDSCRLTAENEDPKAIAFEGFCIGFLESIAVWIREARRKPELISEELLKVEKERALRCVDYISQNISYLRSSLSLSAIAVACALDLANRRLGFYEYEKHGYLNEWLQKVIKRKSFLITEPQPI